ncbi:ABC-type cobalamin/Fe3+-siderophores transport system, component [Corynebacterium deserti GIMN1.010]|uniref:ABC-type cobalamin/Fe3+-siderophores transport system, component n=1 Tax=Corynebacterium deserti GIMN1.010 TaxID=931089 RepID=A0A0M5IRA6_9CORY|nr:iron-siderophore ABC transporter substrate-binding protein [Corynebacterium deserti]ALC06224.1 ABC-type cobalamin/Fe3+-siderophores transport system, component [Corynebacterium deserti GIMN1.010]
MRRTISRRSFLSAMLGTTALAIAACTPTAQSDSQSAEQSPTPDNSSGPDSTQRIVALNTGQLDNLLLLGITPVGVAAAKNADLIPQFLRDRFGSTMDLDSIANCGLRQDPDIEAIANLAPTLICANSRTDEAILSKLRAIAPVVTGEGGGENWKQDFLTIADAAGKSEKATSLLSAYEDSAAAVAASLPTSPPTVSFLRTNDGEFQMYGTQSMAGTVATDCGYARPESQQFTDQAGKDLSAELISEADAEWLFYGVQEGKPSPTETALWPSLSAVQNNHAIAVDYDAWFMNASVVSAETILEGLQSTITA